MIIETTCLALLLVSSGRTQTCDPSNDEVIGHYTSIANNIPNNDIAVAATTGINWEDLLSPAPTAISVLSSLLLVTTGRDVSLENAAPTSGWKYVQFPQSLSASTLQVANEAYYALLEAHTNMDKIRIKTSHVPEIFRSISSIIAKGSGTERVRVLPDAVSRLEHIAIECSELATETASAFDNTGRLIDELILGCQAKKGMSKIEFEDVLIDLQVTTQSRINHEKHLELFEKEATEAEKEIDAAVDKYQKAIDDKPSFLELLAASAVDVATNIANTVVPEVMRMVPTHPLQIANNVAGSLGSVVTGLVDKKKRRKRSANVQGNYVNTNLYKDDLNGIFVTAQEPQRLTQLLQDGKTKEAASGARELSAKLENVQLGLKSDGVPQVVIDSEKQLYDQAQLMLNKTITLSNEVSVDESQMTQLKKTAENWRLDVGALKQQLDSQSNEPMPPQSPTKSESQSVDKGMRGELMNGYRMAIEGQSAIMQVAQKNAEFQRERLDQAVSKSAMLLDKVTRLNLQEAELSEIIEVLHSAIHELTRLSQAWRNLVMFFKMISNQVNENHREKIRQFTDNIKIYIDTADPKNGVFDASTDLLYRTAYKASAENWRINRMSETYVKISAEHFMPPLTNISMLLTLDKTSEEGRKAIQQKSTATSQQMMNTQKAIRKLIDEEREEDNRKRVDYMDRLRSNLQSLCPGDDGIEQKVAAEIVKRSNAKPKLELDYSGGF